MKRYSIKVNGKVFDVEVEEVSADAPSPLSSEHENLKNSLPARTEAGTPEAEKESARDTAAIQRGRIPKTPKKKEQPVKMPEGVMSQEDTLCSPMPGTVLKICVNPGDEVYAGETLVILEAMKMENEINSHKTGRVGMIAVNTGDTVNTGDVLLTVE